MEACGVPFRIPRRRHRSHLPAESLPSRMIRDLHIENFALIDRLDVALFPGLNILTGETGAGKSIIIGALNMVLGERADMELIRQGEEKAVAEAVIAAGRHPDVSWILREHEIEETADLILRREIRRSGSRAFINDTPVPVHVLRQVGDRLVDLHGQHEHQLLLRDEHHRVVLDSFSSVSSLLSRYGEIFTELSKRRKELRELRDREGETARRAELHRFQLQELDELRPDPEEEREMETEMNRLDHAEDLQMKAAAVAELGQAEDGGLLDLLSRIRSHLSDLSEIEPEFRSYLEELQTAQISLQEMVSFTETYRDDVEFDPARLETLRRRQAELNRIKKKYGMSTEQLAEHREHLRKELETHEQADSRADELEARIADLTSALADAAARLHEARTIVGRKFAAKVEETLSMLGIPNARFHVQVDWLEDEDGWIEVDGRRVRCTETGPDLIRFLISTNRGEEPRPLARIASGGEVSRVMLAIKSILASEQALPVMIFDEIDTGISGSISQMVGGMMKKLASSCQILAITHQPQIASHADHHFRVEKIEDQDRTITRIAPLDEEEHIREVARLMSGQDVSEAAVQSARELVMQSRGG